MLSRAMAVNATPLNLSIFPVNTPPPTLMVLPVGTLLSGNLAGKDQKGNYLFKSAKGEFSFKTDLPLAPDANITLKIEEHAGKLTFKLYAIEGKLLEPPKSLAQEQTQQAQQIQQQKISGEEQKHSSSGQQEYNPKNPTTPNQSNKLPASGIHIDTPDYIIDTHDTEMANQKKAEVQITYSRPLGAQIIKNDGGLPSQIETLLSGTLPAKSGEDQTSETQSKVNSVTQAENAVKKLNDASRIQSVVISTDENFKASISNVAEQVSKNQNVSESVRSAIVKFLSSNILQPQLASLPAKIIAMPENVQNTDKILLRDNSLQIPAKIISVAKNPENPVQSTFIASTPMGNIKFSASEVAGIKDFIPAKDIGKQISFVLEISASDIGEKVNEAKDLGGGKSFQAIEEFLASDTSSANIISAQNALKEVLPNFNSKLASAGIFFLLLNKSMGSASAKKYLGEETLKLINAASDDKELIGRILAELSQAGATPVQDRNGGNWQSWMIPVFDQNKIEPVKVYVKDSDDNQDGEGGAVSKKGGSRFIFELSLSELGEMQFDGYFKKQGVLSKQFDLVVRCSNHLPDDIKNSIITLFQNGSELTGVSGMLTFQNWGENQTLFLERNDENPKDNGSLFA